MSYVLKIVGLQAEPERWTPWNDTYLRECYPGRDSAMQLDVGFVSTPDVTQAEQFATPEDALAERYYVNPAYPWKWDSQPNYPLAPFIVSVESVP